MNKQEGRNVLAEQIIIRNEKRSARKQGDRENVVLKKKKIQPERRNDEAYNRRKTNALKNPMIEVKKKGLGRIWNGTANKEQSVG